MSRAAVFGASRSPFTRRKADLRNPLPVAATARSPAAQPWPAKPVRHVLWPWDLHTVQEQAGKGFAGQTFAEQATYAMQRLAARMRDANDRKLRLRIENELLRIARTLRKRACLADACTLARVVASFAQAGVRPPDALRAVARGRMQAGLHGFSAGDAEMLLSAVARLWGDSDFFDRALDPAVGAVRSLAVAGALNAKQAAMLLWFMARFEHRSAMVERTLPELSKVILHEALPEVTSTSNVWRALEALATETAQQGPDWPDLSWLPGGAIADDERLTYGAMAPSDDEDDVDDGQGHGSATQQPADVSEQAIMAWHAGVEAGGARALQAGTEAQRSPQSPQERAAACASATEHSTAVADASMPSAQLVSAATGSSAPGRDISVAEHVAPGSADPDAAWELELAVPTSIAQAKLHSDAPTRVEFDSSAELHEASEHLSNDDARAASGVHVDLAAGESAAWGITSASSSGGLTLPASAAASPARTARHWRGANGSRRLRPGRARRRPLSYGVQRAHCQHAKDARAQAASQVAAPAEALAGYDVHVHSGVDAQGTTQSSFVHGPALNAPPAQSGDYGPPLEAADESAEAPAPADPSIVVPSLFAARPKRGNRHAPRRERRHVQRTASTGAVTGSADVANVPVFNVADLLRQTPGAMEWAHRAAQGQLTTFSNSEEQRAKPREPSSSRPAEAKGAARQKRKRWYSSSDHLKRGIAGKPRPHSSMLVRDLAQAARAKRLAAMQKDSRARQAAPEGPVAKAMPVTAPAPEPAPPPEPARPPRNSLERCTASSSARAEGVPVGGDAKARRYQKRQAAKAWVLRKLRDKRDPESMGKITHKKMKGFDADQFGAWGSAAAAKAASWCAEAFTTDAGPAARHGAASASPLLAEGAGLQQESAAIDMETATQAAWTVELPPQAVPVDRAAWGAQQPQPAPLGLVVSSEAPEKGVVPQAAWLAQRAGKQRTHISTMRTCVDVTAATSREATRGQAADGHPSDGASNALGNAAAGRDTAAAWQRGVASADEEQCAAASAPAEAPVDGSGVAESHVAEFHVAAAEHPPAVWHTFADTSANWSAATQASEAVDGDVEAWELQPVDDPAAWRAYAHACAIFAWDMLWWDRAGVAETVEEILQAARGSSEAPAAPAHAYAELQQQAADAERAVHTLMDSGDHRTGLAVARRRLVRAAGAANGRFCRVHGQQTLATAALAIARLDMMHVSGMEELLRVCAQLFCALPPEDVEPQTAANLAWASAALDRDQAGTLQHIAAATDAILAHPDCRPQSVSLIAYAMAKARFPAHACLEKLADWATPRLRAFRDQELVNLVWACATLQVAHGALHRAAWPRAACMAQRLSARLAEFGAKRSPDEESARNDVVHEAHKLTGQLLFSFAIQGHITAARFVALCEPLTHLLPRPPGGAPPRVTPAVLQGAMRVHAPPDDDDDAHDDEDGDAAPHYGDCWVGDLTLLIFCQVATAWMALEVQGDLGELEVAENSGLAQLVEWSLAGKRHAVAAARQHHCTFISSVSSTLHALGIKHHCNVPLDSGLLQVKILVLAGEGKPVAIETHRRRRVTLLRPHRAVSGAAWRVAQLRARGLRVLELDVESWRELSKRQRGVLLQAKLAAPADAQVLVPAAGLFAAKRDVV